MMRQAWQPVQQRLASGAGGVLDFLGDRPALAQGVYYALVGLWPWAHMNSFLWVTGEKTDLWLVQTVGALVLVIGAALLVASHGHETSRAVVFLALGSATALALVDVIFVLQGRISAVYLLDAIVQGGLVALWVHSWQVRRVQGRAPVAQVVTGPPAANSSPRPAR
jgi:hypothetical protein